MQEHSKEFEEFVHCHLCLAENGTKNVRIQITRMDGNRDQQIAPLQLDMAAALANRMESDFLQSSNDLAGLEGGEFRHTRERERQP